MEEMLQHIALYIAFGLEVVAITLIAGGAIEAVVGILRVLFRAGATNQDRRQVWLMFARWLVAGLTFQLAADLVNSSFEPTWDELGRLAITAVIRTFLSFFLDREIAGTRALQHPGGQAGGRG
jgi:uncharacterized membrane protein